MQRPVFGVSRETRFPGNRKKAASRRPFSLSARESCLCQTLRSAPYRAKRRRGQRKGKAEMEAEGSPLRGGWSAEYPPRRSFRRFESSLRGLLARRFIRTGQSDGLTRGFLPLPARALGSAPHIQCSPHGPARRRSRLRRRSSWQRPRPSWY